MTLELTKTADGLHAAKIGHNGYVISNTSGGTFRVGSTGLGARRLETLRHQDFSYYGEFFKTVDAALEELVSLELHHRQLAPLSRRQTTTRKHTQWGEAHGSQIYAEGVESFVTGSHGGFKLDRARNAKVNPMLRNEGGWYEEDSEWCKVAVTFPELFTDREKAQADRTLKNWYPDEYEAINRVVLADGESHVKDERVFHERHANDWVVIAASGQSDGTCICTATLGGKRGEFGKEAPQERVFVVPTAEYQTRRIAFVIDLNRHDEMVRTPAPSM